MKLEKKVKKKIRGSGDFFTFWFSDWYCNI